MSTAISPSHSEHTASNTETSQERPVARAPRRLRRSGYVGVDIGTTSIKFAHVRMRGRNRDLVSFHSASIDHDASSPSMGKQVGDALRSLGVPRGPIACLLPKACYLEEVLEADLQAHTLDQAFVWTQLQRRGIANPSDISIDWWPVPQFEANSNQVRVQVAGLRNNLVTQFTQDCRNKGYRVRCIDSTTFSAARIVELVDESLANQLVGVLDWGFSSAKLTLIHNGLPIYSRVLREASLRDAIKTVARSLSVSEHDAALLLKRYGTSPVEGRLTPQIRNELDSQLQGYRRNLSRELAKTAGYVRGKLRVTGFQRIIPIGGQVGTYEHLAEIAGESSLEVVPFVPRISNLDAFGDESAGTFALAMSLSTLGFEGRTQ